MGIFLIYAHIFHAEGGKTLSHSHLLSCFPFIFLVGLSFRWQDTEAQTERGLPSFWSTRGFTLSLSAVCRLCNDELLVGRVVLQVRYQYEQIKKKLVTVLWIEVVILEQLDLTWLKTG